MEITGTIVNYYYHCKIQCYLFAHNIKMEQNSELVKIGKELHSEKEKTSKNTEIQIEHIKLDKITDNYVIEYKKIDILPRLKPWENVNIIVMEIMT